MVVLCWLIFICELCVRKPTIWVPTRSDTNQPVQSQKQARSLKFRIKEEEGLYYLCSENKGANQLRGYRTFVFAYANCWFSHAVAHVVSLSYRKRFLYNRAYTTRTQIVLFALFKGPKLQQICIGICSRINASYSTRHLTMVNHMKFHHYFL